MPDCYIAVEVVCRSEKMAQKMKGIKTNLLKFRECDNYSYSDAWYGRAVCYRAIVDHFSQPFIGNDLTALAKAGFDIRVYRL